MTHDTDMLECQVRNLERELAASRETLRDRFAMAALTGYLASFEPTEEPSEYATSIALDCYRLADVMMEVREK